MKYVIIFLLAATGCTHKYADYDLIRKVDFNRQTYERPTPATQVLAQGRDELKECFNQWLFFSNAETEKEKRIPEFIRALCPGKEYLVQTTVNEKWWTTLVFTQSCVSIETMCGDTRQKK